MSKDSGFTAFIDKLPDNRFQQYLAALRTDFTKLSKLEFINPDGTIVYTLDNNPKNKKSRAFIQDSGNLSVNLQNGRRRQLDITLANLDNEFDFAVSKIWFGQELRYSEGLILPDGSEYYLPQGVFVIEKPTEAREPNQSTMQYHLVDKWANIDGGLGGNLDGDYKVLAGTNIFNGIKSVLLLDRFNLSSPGANPIDPIAPLFTMYYNDKVQTLTDGSTVSLVDAPYDLLVEGSGTLGDVALGLSNMLAAWIGYNAVGRLVVDPSQDDILDISKPVLWDFSTDKRQLLSINTVTNVPEVYNDVIVVGATSDDYSVARGRAQNRDPSSPTCISRIGLKTKRIDMPNYYSDDICESYAEFMLKRYSVLPKTVTLTTTQMFHIAENQLITVKRTDKPGSPVERHLIQSFSRPVGQTGTMTINAVSVSDFPIATIVRQN